MSLNPNAQMIDDAGVDCHNMNLMAAAREYIESGEALQGLRGRDIMRLFAIAAGRVLSQDQIEALCRFLRGIKASQANQARINELLTLFERFKVDELAVSGESAAFLTQRLSKAMDAKLGVILHCMTKDGDENDENFVPCDDFWEENISYEWKDASIKMILAKGCDQNRHFGTDALLRASRSREEGDSESICPQRVWRVGTEALHDEIFQDTLNRVHTPLLVIGGKCTFQHYLSCIRQKSNGKRSCGGGYHEARFNSDEDVDVPVYLDSGEKLMFNISFWRGRVLRLAVKVHHPAAPFHASPHRWKAMTSQQDAGYNFMFWLLAESHRPMSFYRADRFATMDSQPSRPDEKDGNGRGYRHTSQWQTSQWDMSREYNRRERVAYRDSKKILPIHMYSLQYIQFVENYTKTTAYEIIESGLPLAEYMRRLALAKGEGQNQRNKNSASTINVTATTKGDRATVWNHTRLARVLELTDEHKFGHAKVAGIMSPEMERKVTTSNIGNQYKAALEKENLFGHLFKNVTFEARALQGFGNGSEFLVDGVIVPPMNIWAPRDPEDDGQPQRKLRKSGKTVFKRPRASANTTPIYHRWDPRQDILLEWLYYTVGLRGEKLEINFNRITAHEYPDVGARKLVDRIKDRRRMSNQNNSSGS